MKRLAILIVIVLVVAGAGGAGWWLLLRVDPSAEQASDIEEGEGKAGKLKRFVEMEPLVLPILREGQVILHLTVVLAIEPANPLTPEELVEIKPRLRDALLSELHAVFAYRHIQDQGYDVPIVKTRLFQASERVLGAGQVKAVLIQNISERAPRAG